MFLPNAVVGELFQATRVANQLVQGDDYLSELGSVAAVLLPAVEHELV